MPRTIERRSRFARREFSSRRCWPIRRGPGGANASHKSARRSCKRASVRRAEIASDFRFSLSAPLEDRRGQTRRTGLDEIPNESSEWVQLCPRFSACQQFVVSRSPVQVGSPAHAGHALDLQVGGGEDGLCSTSSTMTRSPRANAVLDARPASVCQWSIHHVGNPRWAMMRRSDDTGLRAGRSRSRHA